MADGGEGTLAAVTAALRDAAELRAVETTDALGRPITAGWLLLDGGRGAFIEMAAASGLARLSPDERTAENAGRAEIAARYREALHGKSGVSIPFGELEEGTTSAHHLAVALMPAGRRDDVRARLAENRIQTSVHYPPIHLFTHYSRDGAARALPRTEQVAERVMTMPLFAHLRGEQVELVIENVLAALDM